MCCFGIRLVDVARVTSQGADSSERASTGNGIAILQRSLRVDNPVGPPIHTRWSAHFAFLAFGACLFDTFAALTDGLVRNSLVLFRLVQPILPSVKLTSGWNLVEINVGVGSPGRVEICPQPGPFPLSVHHIVRTVRCSHYRVGWITTAVLERGFGLILWNHQRQVVAFLAKYLVMVVVADVEQALLSIKDFIGRVGWPDSPTTIRFRTAHCTHASGFLLDIFIKRRQNKCHHHQ